MLNHRYAELPKSNTRAFLFASTGFDSQVRNYESFGDFAVAGSYSSISYKLMPVRNGTVNIM